MSLQRRLSETPGGVGEGDTFDEALADVKSALAVYVETFGSEVLEAAEDVREVFVSEASVLA